MHYPRSQCLLPGSLLVAQSMPASMAAQRDATRMEHPAYGLQREGFDYPYPVDRYAFDSQRQPLSMAYIDIVPTAMPNGRTVVLLHG